MPRGFESPYFHYRRLSVLNLVLFDRLEVLKWIAGVVLARTCLAGSNPRSSTIVQWFCATHDEAVRNFRLLRALTIQIGKLHGASSIQPAHCQIRQGRKAAAIAGRSGVIWVACPSFFDSSFRKLHEIEK